MKKLLISLLVAGVLVGAVFGAAASITVTGVDELGSGGAAVTAPSNVTDVVFSVDSTDITKIDGVDVAFTAALTGGTVYVEVLDDGADTTCGTGDDVGLDDGLVGGGSNPNSVALAALIADIDCVTVTYTQP